jgi:hypothetical protein
MDCRIKVSVGGLTHFKNFTADARKWALLENLEYVLRDSIYLRSELPDARKDSDPNKIAYHKLGLLAKVGDKPIVAVITVQEDSNGDWIYNADVEGIEIKEPVASKTGLAENDALDQLSAQRQAIITLAQQILAHNDHLTKSIRLPDQVKPSPQHDAIKKSQEYAMTKLDRLISKLFLLRKSRKLHGSINFNGLDISIETGRSRIRQWYNPQDNSQGMSRMSLPYGYIKRTEGTDGDHVDVFVGPDHSAREVYVVHTMKAPDFTKRDEDKCFVGLNSPDEAVRAFKASYNDPRFLGSMSIWPFEEFKRAVYQTKDHLDNTKYLIPTESLNGMTEPACRLNKSTPIVQNIREEWKRVTKSIRS